MIVKKLQGFDAGSGIGGKAMEFTFQPQANDETPEGALSPGDDRHRSGDAGGCIFKVIALKPDPGGWEGLSPVFLDIATTACEIHLFTIEE